MCWWKIFQPCVPDCLDSWRYTSTSLNFCFFELPLKWRMIEANWLRGVYLGKPPAGQEQRAHRRRCDTLCICGWVSQCHRLTVWLWSLGSFLVWSAVHFFPRLCPRTFSRLSDGRCAFFMAPKDGPSCAASGGGDRPFRSAQGWFGGASHVLQSAEMDSFCCLDRFIFTVCNCMYLFIYLLHYSHILFLIVLFAFWTLLAVHCGVLDCAVSPLLRFFR